MDFLLDLLKNAILSLMTSYPGVGTLIFVVGMLRLVMKPVMALIDQVVTATPTPTDNEMWEKIKASSVFKALVFFIDWFGSIKLKK